MPPTSQPPVRIGARGSKLSVVQATLIQRRIAAALGATADDVEAFAPLIRITTTGDRVQDRRLLEIGGKGLFTKEIEEALLDRRIDCAVHSLKDMPAEPARAGDRRSHLGERRKRLQVGQRAPDRGTGKP